MTRYQEENIDGNCQLIEIHCKKELVSIAIIRYKMFLILPILIVLSLNAIVDANKVTFAKVGGRFYVETDSQHYAMFGQVTDNDGPTIVAVNGDTYCKQNSKCKIERTELKEVDQEHLKSYAEIKERYLQDARNSMGASEDSDGNKFWSNDISNKPLDYWAVKIDNDIVAYSSPWLPSKLARVILAGSVVIFVHHDGQITMKTTNCLLPMEKKLFKGIKKINIGDGLMSRFTPVGDEALHKYLKRRFIDESQLYIEQEYIVPKKKEKPSMLMGNL